MVATVIADGCEVDETREQFPVRHRLHVAEVGLGGSCQRGDDLVTALHHRISVARDLVQQGRRARGGVVQEVDVGAQTAESAGHARLEKRALHPALPRTGRCGQGSLDASAGGRLSAGHGDGSQQNRIDRHRGSPVLETPSTGQQLVGALGSANPATDGEHHIVVFADRVVGVQQQGFEVLPGMVTPGLAALDVKPQGVLTVLSDVQCRPNLGAGTRLERVEPDAQVVELIQQGHGDVAVRDAGRDRDPADGGPCRTRLLHQARCAEVEIPQVRVEV